MNDWATESLEQHPSDHQGHTTTTDTQGWQEDRQTWQWWTTDATPRHWKTTNWTSSGWVKKEWTPRNKAGNDNTRQEGLSWDRWQDQAKEKVWPSWTIAWPQLKDKDDENADAHTWQNTSEEVKTAGWEKPRKKELTWTSRRKVADNLRRAQRHARDRNHAAARVIKTRYKHAGYKEAHENQERTPEKASYNTNEDIRNQQTHVITHAQLCNPPHQQQQSQHPQDGQEELAGRAGPAGRQRKGLDEGQPLRICEARAQSTKSHQTVIDTGPLGQTFVKHNYTQNNTPTCNNTLMNIHTQSPTDLPSNRRQPAGRST